LAGLVVLPPERMKKAINLRQIGSAIPDPGDSRGRRR
jgi:hypothetical protein